METTNLPLLESEKPKNSSKCHISFNVNQIVAGLSLMGTDYNLFVINMVLVVLEAENGTNTISSSNKSLMATMCLIGAAIGQLSFGFIGDKIGRRKGMVLTMVITIIGALGSAFSYDIGKLSMYNVIALWRLVLGIGAGGVYPLSATMSAESAERGEKSKSTARTFAMQGVANVLSPLLCWLFLEMTAKKYTTVWRLSFAMGALPAVVIIILSFWTVETQKVVDKDDTKSIKMMDALKQRQYWNRLVGSAGCWFLLDLTLYANILFGPMILDKIMPSSTPVSTAQQYLIVAAIGLPGYLISVYYMEKLGSRNIQLMGFIMMFFIYLALGIFLDDFLKLTAVMIIFYGLSFFFTNFGPNATTFLLSTELFPREVRGSFNGISAATGKCGAILAALFFQQLNEAQGTQFTFILCALIACLGGILTYIFVHHPDFSPRPAFQSSALIEVDKDILVGITNRD